MAVSKTKKSFKLCVPGLFNLEMDDWTNKKGLPILILIMVFILGIFFLLKAYAIPALGIPAVINKVGTGIEKIIKSRAP